jgi:hypothetical protein
MGMARPRRGTLFTVLPFKQETVPWEIVLLRPWHEPCLLEGGPRIKNYSAQKKQERIYEKVSIRFNCGCGGFVTAQPERSSALGLLSSLLWWIPCLLASPLLAWRLVVWWILASRLLVPWPSGRRGAVLVRPWNGAKIRKFWGRSESRSSLCHTETLHRRGWKTQPRVSTHKR